MKKNYIYFMLCFLTATIFAQTQNDYEVIQTKKNGIVVFEKINKKKLHNKSLGKTKLNSPNSTSTVTYLANESFETWIPTGWDVYVDVSQWEQDDIEFHTGAYSAWSAAEPYADTWLISPSIDLSTATSAFLKYYENFILQDTYWNDQYNVFVSTNYTNNGNPYSASWDLVHSGVGTENSWTFQVIDLQNYVGSSTVFIAFQYVGSDDGSGNPPYGYDWYIDDVSVTDDSCSGTEPAPNCATIASPPNGSTLLPTDLAVEWHEPDPSTTTKQLLYVGTDGGGTTTPTNYYNGIELSSATFGVHGSTLLTPNTTYYWQVIPVNCSSEAQNCPIWSFTTGDGNVNTGGGGSTQGEYIFTNSIAGTPSQPTYNWIDISGTGTDLISLIGDEETKGPYNLGFSFNFFGNIYTQFYINSNGFITFTNTSGSTNFPFAIPGNYTPDNIIAGYWMNLNPTNANVTGKHLYYGMKNGEMVITYEKYPQIYWDGSAYIPNDANGWITFQIILNPNGIIKIQFKEKGSSFVDADFYTGTVGIENSNGTQGISYRRQDKEGPIFNGTSPLAVEFTPVHVSAAVKIFLEGPFNSGSMSTSLGTSIPLTQPYSNSPWNYNGNEKTTQSFISNNNIVDWVLVELRTGSSAATATTVVSTRAALLRNDGVILDTDGSTDIDFYGIGNGDYYIAVYHRNHLAVLSSSSVNLN